MGAAELASLLLTIGGEVARLAAQAIDASRAGDDQKALELLDAAIAKLRDQVAQLPTALDQVKADIAKRIADKFPG
jgi:uncharacterized protein YceH (UPF0502 family)